MSFFIPGLLAFAAYLFFQEQGKGKEVQTDRLGLSNVGMSIPPSIAEKGMPLSNQGRTREDQAVVPSLPLQQPTGPEIVERERIREQAFAPVQPPVPVVPIIPIVVSQPPVPPSIVPGQQVPALPPLPRAPLSSTF